MIAGLRRRNWVWKLQQLFEQKYDGGEVMILDLSFSLRVQVARHH